MLEEGNQFVSLSFAGEKKNYAWDVQTHLNTIFFEPSRVADKPPRALVSIDRQGNAKEEHVKLAEKFLTEEIQKAGVSVVEIEGLTLPGYPAIAKELNFLEEMKNIDVEMLIFGTVSIALTEGNDSKWSDYVLKVELVSAGKKRDGVWQTRSYGGETRFLSQVETDPDALDKVVQSTVQRSIIKFVPIAIEQWQTADGKWTY